MVRLKNSRSHYEEMKWKIIGEKLCCDKRKEKCQHNRNFRSRQKDGDKGKKTLEEIMTESFLEIKKDTRS